MRACVAGKKYLIVNGVSNNGLVPCWCGVLLVHNMVFLQLGIAIICIPHCLSDLRTDATPVWSIYTGKEHIVISVGRLALALGRDAPRSS